MAVRRRLLRLGAVLAGLAGLGVTLPTLAATGEKCCSVRLAQLGGTVTAGGDPARFTVDMTGTGKACTQVRPTVVVRLVGLKPNQVRIERLARGTWQPLRVTPGGAGAVQAVDPAGLRVCGADRTAFPYRVRFLAASPSGTATLAALANTPAGEVVGRDATATMVVRPAPPRQPGKEPEPVRQKQPGPELTKPGLTNPEPTQTEAPAEAPTAENSVVDSPPATEAPPAAAAGKPDTPSRLASAAVTTGYWAAAVVGVALVALVALRLWRRRKGESDGIEPAPVLSIPVPSRPTLPSRWPAQASTIRRKGS